MNCIRAPCAPSHTEIGNFPQPRLWKRSPANDNSRAFGAVENEPYLLISGLSRSPASMLVS